MYCPRASFARDVMLFLILQVLVDVHYALGALLYPVAAFGSMGPFVLVRDRPVFLVSNIRSCNKIDAIPTGRISHPLTVK